MSNPRSGWSSLHNARSLCLTGVGAKRLLKSQEIHGAEGPRPSCVEMASWHHEYRKVLGERFRARGWERRRERRKAALGGFCIAPECTHAKVPHLRGHVGPVRCWWASPFRKTPSAWAAAPPWKGSLGARTAWGNWEILLRHFWKISSLRVIKYSDSKGTQNPHISGEFYLLHIISNFLIQQYSNNSKTSKCFFM